MKNLLIIFTMLFSTVFFSSPSYAEWTKLGTTGGGANTYYVDFERIRKHDGFVYFWELDDYLQPIDGKVFSLKMYTQGDCKSFRYMTLSSSFHTQPLGGGTPSSSGSPKNPEWDYPPPNSMMETILKSVCNR